MEIDKLAYVPPTVQDLGSLEQITGSGSHVSNVDLVFT